jgi:phosphoglycerate dehydrogenase-like enzyme
LAVPGPILVVEDDLFTRIVELVLDPNASAERTAAYADFFAHDEPDFAGWCDRVRALAPNLYPAAVRIVGSHEELRAGIGDAHGAIVESIVIAEDDIAAAPRLSVIHKFGVGVRGIDMAACARRAIKVLTIRRRANIACAETAIGLMLTLAKKLHRLTGRISPEQLTAVGYAYRPFDRRHTPNTNWPRIPGIRMLRNATLGIVGLGEIGREIAVLANAFGMRVLYYQRTRHLDAEERELCVCYASLDTLLAESDWVIPQLPSGPSTRNLIDRTAIARMKPGACIVNVARADLVERTAVIEALRSGHLGGFALDPQYEEPGRSDDELLGFDNVVLIPHTAAQPRFNALDDISDMIAALARELRS